MKRKRLVLATTFALASALLLAGNANATTITFSTTPGTGFSGGGLTLDNSSGQPATLAFVPDSRPPIRCTSWRSRWAWLRQAPRRSAPGAKG